MLQLLRQKVEYTGPTLNIAVLGLIASESAQAIPAGAPQFKERRSSSLCFLLFVVNTI
jgi:hypothetical protein